jgi:predicted XRE-type DNA-binding protein
MKETTLERELSSGNVFADLGLPDAEEHLVKAGLVLKLGKAIRAHGMTQAEAAGALGIDQPKVSALLRGQFRGYSVERLMRFLVALGHDVEIVVRAKRRGPAQLRVA